MDRRADRGANFWQLRARFSRIDDLFGKGATEMQEAIENGQQNNQSMIHRGENRMSEFSDTAHDYGRKVADAASRATDYIEEKAGVVGEKFKNLQGKNFSEIADDAKDYARRKPGQAILISAAAGLFLGFLLRNSRRVF
jgi:ElaB/YqjD/DUF883 family membrane-anchored ribosome-binding protein